MFTALRSLTGASASGSPLPRVPELQKLYDREIIPRKGEIVMISGRPKSGKSAFGLWWLYRMGLRTLYFSADTNRYQTSTRLAGLASGQTVENVRQSLDSGNPSAIAYFGDALADCNIQFCFDTSPTVADIAEELDAYVELWDAYPEAIVIDNVTKVQADHENEWSGLRMILDELHAMVRMTGCTLFVMHHNAEGVGDADTPAPSKALHGKVSQLPEWVLSVHANSLSGEFKVSCVAARSAPCDPTGKTYTSLRADLARNTFSPWVNIGYGYQGWGQDD